MSAAVTVGIQLGDAGGIETTGYVAGIGIVQGTPTHTTSTTFFPVYVTGGTTDVLDGSVILSLEDSSDFTWVLQGAINGANGVGVSGGRKATSAEVTTLRIMNGTFDAGAINVQTE